MLTSVLKMNRLAVATATVVLLSAPGAWAQGALEEITVTAQKREQSLQDVGISVAAFSGEQLEQMGVTNMTDVVYQVPGLQLFTYNPGNVYFNLRGVSQNSFLDSVEAPVAVYIDDAYMASTNGLGQHTYDMERVEVLRGPQGTLFGRNATGGVIHYITKAPVEEELNGYIKGGYGAKYDNYSVEGALGGALSPTVRFRAAGRWERADGYTQSIREGVRDTNGKDGFSLRGALQWEAAENVLVDLKLSRTDDNDAPTGGYVIYTTTSDPDTGFGNIAEGETTTGDVHKHNNEQEGRLNRSVTGFTGKITWDINDGLEAAYVFNWTDIDKDYFEDAGGGFILNFPYNPVAETTQLTHEWRLAGELERLRWQAGAYRLDLDIDGRDFVGGSFVSYLDEGEVHNEWDLKSENWSIFGQAEFDLTPELTFIAGARFSRDDKSFHLVNFADGEGACSPPIPQEDDPTMCGGRIYPPRSEAENDAEIAASVILDTDDGYPAPDVNYSDFALRAQLDWKPNEDLLAYVSFNRGIKGGSYTVFATQVNADPSNVLRTTDSGYTAFATQVGPVHHDEEVLHAYEAGFKASFPQYAMRVDGAGFYYDYDDYQAFGLVQAFPVIVNRDAEIWGGELSVSWNPRERLALRAGLSVLESKISSVPDAKGTRNIPADDPTNADAIALLALNPDAVAVRLDPMDPGSALVYAETNNAETAYRVADEINGTEVPSAPSFSLNFLARQSWPIGGGDLALQVDGNYNSAHYLDVFNSAASKENAYFLGNVRASWASSDDRWMFEFFIKNFTDAQHRLYVLDLAVNDTFTPEPIGDGFIENVYAPPRWFGASATFRF